jgi:hypothetical protein
MKGAKLNGLAYKQTSLDYNEILKLWNSPVNRRIALAFT